MNENFIPFLEKTDFDLLIIDGDYFDKKVGFMDVAGIYACSLMLRLTQLSREKGFKIRMVQGTRSHDLNQLNIFKSYEEDPSIDFRIYETVQKETIDGYDLLFIPEEYVFDPDEYYKDYKAKDARYSAIFGHGTWDFVSPPMMIDNSKNKTIKTEPVFMYDEWKHTIPDGFVSFGHIHSRHTYKKKIFYSGAYSVWGFGEKSDRGFTYFEIDDEGKYKVDFHNNTSAPVYDTCVVSELIDTTKEVDIEKLKLDIEKHIIKVDKLRLDISGLNESVQIVLKKTFADNPDVQVECKNKKVQLSESKKAEADQFAKYHYITKRQVPIEEMISRYCKEDLGYDISVDDIKKIITK